MRLGYTAAGIVLAAATSVAPAHAQDVRAGRAVAGRICATCHDVDGIAKLPKAANLAGQDATYLTPQLEAFREGTRVHEQVLVIAKPLSDTRMADVAAYYNAVQIEVVHVPGQ